MFYDFENGNNLCNNFTSILRTKKGNSPKFIAYLLYDLYQKGVVLRYQNKTTGIINLKLDRYLHATRINLPPLETQKRIVALLDKAQELIDKRKEQIALMDQLIQSLFHDMFGDPVTNPKGWDSISLGDCLSFMTSGSRGWAKYYAEEGAIFIRIQNVKNSKLNFDSTQYVNAPNTKEADRTRVKENDIILSITADLGRTAVVDKTTADFGAHINQHLCIIRLSEMVNPFYVSFYIESDGGKKQIEKYDQVGVKSGLNFDLVKKISILNPPLKFQNEFADRVQKIETQKEAMTTSLKELEDNFNSLMQRAFKGEL